MNPADFGRVAGWIAATVDPTAYFAPDEIAIWRSFSESHYITWFVGLAAKLVLYAYLIAFGGSARIMGWCERAAARLWPPAKTGPVSRVLDRMWKDRTWVAALLFVLALALVFAVVFTPTSAYFQLVHDKRAGLSTQTWSGFLWDLAKGGAIDYAAEAALVFGVYGLMRRVDRWWLLLGPPVALLSLWAGVVDPYRPLVNFKYTSLPDGEARTAVAEVAAKAGVSPKDVVVMNATRVTTGVNAFLAGEGPSLRVVLYDTMLQAMTPRELAVAVAHELAHLKEPRLAGSAATASAMFLFIFGLDRLLRWMAKRPRFRLRGHADPAGLPVAFFVVFLALQVGQPVSAAYRRSLEHRADSFAVELTGDPDAYLSMVVKLARRNLADIDPPAYIRWRRSHPTVLERLAFGEKMKTRAGVPPRSAPGIP